MALVYGIRPKSGGDYFYVGCTAKPLRARFKQHLDGVRYDQHANRHFANKVKKLGYRVAVDVLEETEDGQQFAREEWWIKYLLGQGAKLTNIIHNGREPVYMVGGASKYSLRNNWEWAGAWYADFQRGYALRPERPEDDQMMLAAQRTLAEVVGGILAAPLEQQAAMLARFE